MWISGYLASEWSDTAGAFLFLLIITDSPYNSGYDLKNDCESYSADKFWYIHPSHLQILNVFTPVFRKIAFAADFLKRLVDAFLFHIGLCDHSFKFSHAPHLLPIIAKCGLVIIALFGVVIPR